MENETKGKGARWRGRGDGTRLRRRGWGSKGRGGRGRLSVARREKGDTGERSCDGDKGPQSSSKAGTAVSRGRSRVWVREEGLGRFGHKRRVGRKGALSGGGWGRVCG